MKDFDGAQKYYKKALELGKIDPTLSRDLKEPGEIEARLKNIEKKLEKK